MREFSVSSGGMTLAGATTMVFINPAAAPNPNLEFLRFWASQYNSTATSAEQRIQLETQATAFPTLTSATPTKLKPSDPNASVITGGTAGAAGTAGINASAEGAGTKTTVWDDVFNVINGWLHIPSIQAGETRVMPAGFAQGLGLFLPVAPAVLTGWSAGMLFREV
jgi:hypothetical protein